MSGGTVTAAQSSYISTIATASTAETTTFANRYGYVAVTNLSATAGDFLTVVADGSTPQLSGAGTGVIVAPGQTRVIANGLGTWYQTSNVIPVGVNQFGGGNTSSGPASPGTVQSQRSLAGNQPAGGYPNPGTKVTVISATASLPYAIEGTG